MKRLNLLSASILIASALLLSAAGENPETPKPQPKQNAYTQSPTQQHSPASSASVSATFQATSAPPAGQRASNTYNYYYPAKDTWDWSGIVQAIATLGLLGFALWQMDFVRRSTKATENAAKAASDNAKAAKDAAIATERYVEMTKQMVEATKQSAHAADLALNVEKPFVFLEEPKLETYTESVPQFGALPLPQYVSVQRRWIGFELRNRSKGVAIIEAIRLRACIVRRSTWESSGTKQVRIQQRVVGPGEKPLSGTSIPYTVAPPVIDRIDERFAIFGFIKYRDVYDRHYKSTFNYFYYPGTLLRPQGAYFYLGPEKHNRIIELK